MYLTAQRVQTRDRSREGVNVFVFRHGQGAPGIDWRAPDVARIADSNPGTLMLELISVPPAMNDVTSYLDVVAPEGERSAELARAIQQGATLYPGTEKVPATWSAGPVHLRFQANPLIHPDAASEFQRLKDRLLLVLGSGLAAGTTRGGVLRAPTPLRVESRRELRGVRYFLDAASRRLLHEARPELQLPQSLGVTEENLEALTSMYGAAIHEEFAVALTGLGLDQIRAVSGIVFLDPEGRISWRSNDYSGPARRILLRTGEGGWIAP
jgi:hypothetical protein